MLRGTSTVPQWERDNAGNFDQAGTGKSALFAAVLRSVFVEIYMWTDDEIIGAFNDLEKFFDIIDIVILIAECIKSRFPLLMLFLTLQQHSAPRVLQSRRFISKPATVSYSILAGCMRSVALTRGLLLRVLALHFKLNPQAPPSTFVDDTSMLARAPREQLLGIILDSLIHFASLVRSLGLTLSVKATLVARSHDFANKVARTLNRVNIPFKSE